MITIDELKQIRDSAEEENINFVRGQIKAMLIKAAKASLTSINTRTSIPDIIKEELRKEGFNVEQKVPFNELPYYQITWSYENEVLNEN